MNEGSTPTCVACGKLITFYMHQRYGKDGMEFFHPECCPEQRCKERENIHAHQDETAEVASHANT